MCKINGRKLKEIRERKGLTLQDVAKNCGVSYSTISKYESEINNPSDETVDKICLLLKINKDEIKIADVGYNFTSGEGKLTEKIRKKKNNFLQLMILTMIQKEYLCGLRKEIFTHHLQTYLF